MKEQEQNYKTTLEAIKEANKDNDFLNREIQTTKSKLKQYTVSENQIRALRYGGRDGRKTSR